MAAAPISRNAKKSNARRTPPRQQRDQPWKDVRLRSNFVWQQRTNRLFSIFSRVLLVIGLVVGLYFGVTKAITMLLLKNPEYNVTEISVDTDGVLQPDVVLQAAALHKGENIYMLNLSRAKARIEAIPEVEKAQVTRQPPNRITIQINERKPVAWIVSGRGPATHAEVSTTKNAYFIDARGILLQPRKITPQDAYLPLIRSYSSGPLADGQEAAGDEVHAALDLLHAHQDSLIAARFQIEEIDLSKHFGLEVKDRNGLQVLFGLDDMDRQLKRLDVYLQTIDQRGQKPQTINLLTQRNVPVTFVTEAAPMDQMPAAPAVASPSVGASQKNSTGGKEKTKDKSHGKQKTGESKRRT